MAPKHHLGPSLEATASPEHELGKARATVNILASRSADMRVKAETMLQRRPPALRKLERMDVVRRGASIPRRPSTGPSTVASRTGDPVAPGARRRVTSTGRYKVSVNDVRPRSSRASAVQQVC
jgi:hypothetical protein